MNSSLLNKGRWFWQKIKPRGRLGFISIFLLAGAGFVALFVADIHPAYAGLKEELAIFVGNLFLGMAAKIMALTVFVLRFVIEIASYNHYINAPAVQLGWVLVRDVTNMFFVLILMLIAFGTVLGIEQYEWKKLLVKFVLAAILVNFSRLICGVMIDAAQVFMMTFISGVAATAGGNLVNALHMNDILSFSSTTSPEAMSDTMNIVISGIMSFVFAGIALIVIGAYLFMLIARVIALWILIILSPLAFVLGVVPKFQSYATQWWTEFTNNVLSGPVLAFFLWLAFAVAGGANIHDEFGGENASYQIGDVQTEAAAMAEAAGDDTGTNANMILDWENLANFILAAGLMIAGVKTTQKLSAAGAGMLGTAAGAATKFAMVASGAAAGIAAAKWAGKTAATGAKAVALAPAKYVGKKFQAAGLAIKAGAYEKADVWNRFIEHRGKEGGTKGVGGWFQRRLMIGGTNQEIETRKKKVEAAKIKFGTSIVEKESLKQSIADIEAETERGMGFKEEKKAKRRERGLTKAGEKMIKPSNFWGEGESKKFGELTATAFAKAEAINEEVADAKMIETALARDALTGKGTNLHANAALQAISQRKQEKLFNPMNYEQITAQSTLLQGDYDGIGRYSEFKKEVDDYEKLSQNEKDEMMRTNPERVAKIEERAGKITDLNKRYTGLEKPENAAKQQAEIGERINMLAAAAGLKGGSTARDVTENLYTGVVKQENEKRKKEGKEPAKADVDMGKLPDIQAKHLSIWLHRFVEHNKDAVEAAFNELKEQKGRDFVPFLSQQMNALNAAGSTGNVNEVKLFNLDPTGENYIPSTEIDWKDDRRVAIGDSIGKTKGLKAMMDMKFDTTEVKEGEFTRVIDSEGAMDNIAEYLAGMSKLRAGREHGKNIESLNTAIGKMTDEKLAKFIDKVIAKSPDMDALRALANRFEGKGKEKILAALDKKGGGGGGPADEEAEKQYKAQEERAAAADKEAAKASEKVAEAEKKVQEIEIKIKAPSMEGFERTSNVRGSEELPARRAELEQLRKIAEAQKETAKNEKAVAEELRQQKKNAPKGGKKAKDSLSEEDDEDTP